MTVQKGANSQFGGRHDGLASRSYQSPGGTTAPVAAARKQAPTKATSTSIEGMSILAPYRRRSFQQISTVVADRLGRPVRQLTQSRDRSTLAGGFAIRQSFRSFGCHRPRAGGP